MQVVQGPGPGLNIVRRNKQARRFAGLGIDQGLTLLSYVAGDDRQGRVHGLKDGVALTLEQGGLHEDVGRPQQKPDRRPVDRAEKYDAAGEARGGDLGLQACSERAVAGDDKQAFWHPREGLDQKAVVLLGRQPADGDMDEGVWRQAKSVARLMPGFGRGPPFDAVVDDTELGAVGGRITVERRLHGLGDTDDAAIDPG